MIYTLVGAPDTGKQDIAEKLRDFLNEGNCSDDCFKIVVDDEREDLGFLADYRSELHLTATRAINLPGKQNLIFTHSLIDSVAYTSLRVSGLVNYDPSSDELLRWSLAFDAALTFLVDGFNSDVTLYIPYKGDDQDSGDLDKALLATLNTFNISFTEINPDNTEVNTWITS